MTTAIVSPLDPAARSRRQQEAIDEDDEDPDDHWLGDEGLATRKTTRSAEEWDYVRRLGDLSQASFPRCLSSSEGESTASLWIA